MPLTETDIKALSPHPERHRWVNDGAGLYLRIAPSDRRTWIWRTKTGGKTSYFTLGEWPELSVKAARVALAKRTGRATPPNALTVKDALEEWYSDQIEPRYRRTSNIRVYVDRAIAEFGAQRLQELTRADIRRAVAAYAKASPVAANRCLQTWKLALGWCVEVDYLEHSPADRLTRRIAGGEEQSRSRVLSDAEIRALWALRSSPYANLLRALLLTGCRIAELQQAADTHLFRGAAAIKDFARDPGGEWLFIPAANSKNARAHHVYLVPEARAQFNGRAPLLFQASGPTTVQKWLQRVQTDERTGDPRESWASIRPIDRQTQEPHARAFVPHDLRRTFATRLGDLGVAPHVIEKMLNHTPQGVAGIYNRAELLEERIAATKRWAAELARIVA